MTQKLTDVFRFHLRVHIYIKGVCLCVCCGYMLKILIHKMLVTKLQSQLINYVTNVFEFGDCFSNIFWYKYLIIYID